jgi:hypothetical protein
MSRYKKTRDSAREQFHAVRFDPASPKASLEGLLNKALARFDVEIGWYDRHAGRRRFASAVIRTTAVVLAAVSIALLDIAAFLPEALPADGIKGVAPASWATLSALGAGIVLMIDQVGQVTKRYTRWRLIEYKLRIHRVDFEAQFLKAFGAKPDSEVTANLFNEAKAMATEAYGDVLDEIHAETESWKEGVEAGIELLRERLKTIKTEARSRVERATEKRETERSAQEEKEKDEQLQRAPVALNVTVEKLDGRGG